MKLRLDSSLLMWGLTLAVPSGAPVWCQTSPASSQALPPGIDIGAENAPFSDAERTALNNAVNKHLYSAEKAVLDEARAGHPESRELLIVAGRLAYLEKHPADAVEALEKADRMKALDEEDRLTLALAEQFSGKSKEARAQYALLMRAAPDRAEYPYLAARLDFGTANYAEAVKGFQRALQLDPEMVKAYGDLGRALERISHSAEARKAYEDGAARNRMADKKSEFPPFELGVFVMNASDPGLATTLFKESLVYNPKFGAAHYYLGLVAEQKELYSQAFTEYQTAVVNTPSLREAWLGLAREYSRTGRKDDAEHCLSIAKQLERPAANLPGSLATPRR